MIAALFKTLASKNDKILATDKWPPMILDNGLQVGSKGGHGPIKYTVQEFKPDEFIQFAFTRPKGFNGFHKFEMTRLNEHNRLCNSKMGHCHSLAARCVY
jgi:hypothetical protein